MSELDCACRASPKCCQAVLCATRYRLRAAMHREEYNTSGHDSEVVRIVAVRLTASSRPVCASLLVTAIDGSTLTRIAMHAHSPSPHIHVTCSLNAKCKQQLTLKMHEGIRRSSGRVARRRKRILVQVRRRISEYCHEQQQNDPCIVANAYARI